MTQKTGGPAGRPRLYKEPMEPIRILLPKTLFGLIRANAETAGLSVSDVIRTILRQFYEKQLELLGPRGYTEPTVDDRLDLLEALAEKAERIPGRQLEYPNLPELLRQAERILKEVQLTASPQDIALARMRIDGIKKRLRIRRRQAVNEGGGPQFVCPECRSTNSMDDHTSRVCLVCGEGHPSREPRYQEGAGMSAILGESAFYVLARSSDDLTEEDLKTGFPGRFTSLGEVCEGWKAFLISDLRNKEQEKLLVIFGRRFFHIPAFDQTRIDIAGKLCEIKKASWVLAEDNFPDVLYECIDIDGRRPSITGRDCAKEAKTPAYWQVGGQEWKLDPQS
jgi:hypothetical protein